jgi:ribosomal protein S3AE
MKKITFVIIGAILMLSGVTLAQQRVEEKKDSSMRDMMQEMMKEKESGAGSMQGMSGMGGMMRMMKMMEQCSAMMESSHHEGKAAKEGQK